MTQAQLTETLKVALTKSANDETLTLKEEYAIEVNGVHPVHTPKEGETIIFQANGFAIVGVKNK
jgi:hypothetical protein